MPKATLTYNFGHKELLKSRLSNKKKLLKKIELDFDLDDYNESLAFKRAVLADDSFSALWDISQVIRKYSRNKNNEVKTKEQSELISKIESKFYEILNDNNINLDVYQ